MKAPIFKHARRNGGALLGASALLALAGCGGGSSNNNPSNSGLTSVAFRALTDDNRLVSFDSRTPGTSTVSAVTNLTAGDTLRAIDFRFAPPSNLASADFNGNVGLYAIGQNGSSQQLYALFFNATGASATAVGPRFNLIAATPTATAFGFDFNPTVDRIRVVEPTSNRDFRLNPNTGGFVDGDPATAGVQGDGTVIYDPSDVNVGKDPDAVGAAYSNPDADSTTGTALYILDAGNDKLAIQGRVEDPATPAIELVSPNSGRLFTVANLTIDLAANSGFDISPTNNAAFVSNGNRFYGINLTTGRVTGGANIRVPSGVSIIGIAAVS